MKRVLRVIWVLVGLMFINTYSYANVSLKNGNFFIGYTDIIYSGGFEPKIEKVYNSKSSFNGMFGVGWGSDYEVYITPSADGSLVVHENGGGAHNRFVPQASIAEKDITAAIETIAAARVKEGSNRDDMQSYRNRLRSDARFRNDEWERLFEQGKVQARAVPEGMQYRSNRFSYQVITKSKKGYMRTFDTGRVESFDERGRLVRISDKNQNFVNIIYGRDGRMQTIEDNFNRRMNLTFNNRGKLASVRGDGGKNTSYEYDGDLLVKSKDVENNVYEYRYSNDGRFNLVEIRYTDGTKLQVGYNAPTKGETVKWVKERDGTVTEYDYGNDGSGGLHYWTSTVIKGTDGKVLARSKYDYTEKIKNDGEHYLYRMLTEIDNEKTETIYNECCQLPLKIARNGEETTFEYDTRGHVTKKTNPFEVTELSYDPKINKVSKVVRYSKSDASKAGQRWATYQYDNAGNLIFAKNSVGRGVRIIYDTNGRIKALVDQDKRRLEFVYNEQSKPIKIIDPSVGQIDVTYANSGEIKKVSSSGGRKIALQVTSAFQNLLEVIRDAGVRLDAF